MFPSLHIYSNPFVVNHLLIVFDKIWSRWFDLKLFWWSETWNITLFHYLLLFCRFEQTKLAVSTKQSYISVISVRLTLPLLIVHVWVKFCMCTVFLSACAHAGLWMCLPCSWRCQVVPSTVGSWHAVRQWSDWSKTTREEQAELPAAISLPDSDGYGQGSQICSARLCLAEESQCSQGNLCGCSVGDVYR